MPLPPPWTGPLPPGTQVPPGADIRKVVSPFQCPAGAGTLQPQDLVQLKQVAGSDRNPEDPSGAMWELHLTLRLMKALHGDKATVERYLELARRVKAGHGTKSIHQAMAAIEGRAIPPVTCGQCQKSPTSNDKLLRCSRCRNAHYCNKDCQKAHWEEHKKGCKKVKDPVLANAQELARLMPDTFQAPSEADAREVQATMHVKVCVQNVERFWVEVEKSNLAWPLFIGRVDNMLDFTNKHGLKYNDRIQFSWENIYQIQFPLDWTSPLYTTRG